MAASLADGRDILGRIKVELPHLPAALQAIAHAVLDDPGTTATLSVADFARRSGTSPATVVRFCQALGLAGFQQLRLRLASETGRAAAERWNVDLGFEIGRDDSIAQVAAVVARADVQSIHRTTEQLDLDAAERAAQKIAVAAGINIYGIGGSALAAEEMAMRLHRIGRPVWARTEGHSAETSASLLTPRDVAIGISHSGATGEIVTAIQLAAGRGATTIAITNDPQSPLAAAAGDTLTTAVYGTTFRHGGSSARHAQLLLLDCIYVRVAQLTYARATECLAATADIPNRHLAT